MNNSTNLTVNASILRNLLPVTAMGEISRYDLSAICVELTQDKAVYTATNGKKLVVVTHYIYNGEGVNITVVIPNAVISALNIPTLRTKRKPITLTQEKLGWTAEHGKNKSSWIPSGLAFPPCHDLIPTLQNLTYVSESDRMKGVGFDPAVLCETMEAVVACGNDLSKKREHIAARLVLGRPSQPGRLQLSSDNGEVLGLVMPVMIK